MEQVKILKEKNGRATVIEWNGIRYILDPGIFKPGMGKKK